VERKFDETWSKKIIKYTICWFLHNCSTFYKIICLKSPIFTYCLVTG
jgi:hypothetical protein